jgi:glycosyltransferase involved in cell wall biosynthesis
MARKSRQRRRSVANSTQGTVVLLSAELGRYTVAQQCFDALQLPPGSQRIRYAGRSNVADSRNAIAEMFTGDWLAMIDDDHVYQPEMLLTLIRHLDDPRVDIVTPLIMRRRFPHPNVLVLASDDPAKHHEMRQVVLDPAERGLREVHGAGAGVMVLRRRVFERVPKPWFEWGRTSEDYALCLKARAAGCRIYCDLDTRVGHILPMVVWPGRTHDGGFVAMYSHLSSSGSPGDILDGVRRNHAATDERQARKTVAARGSGRRARA